MKVCKNKNDFRNVMPPKDNILKFNQYMKSNKMSLFILTFNLKNSSQMCETSGKTFNSRYISCGYSLSTIWVFNHIENKQTLYGGKDMKRFYGPLREHATNVIKLEKKKMLLLTKRELQLHHDPTTCYIREKKFAKDKNHQKIRDHCHYTGKYRVKYRAHSICSLRFNALKEIPVGFHNRSNYDYHFIIKEFSNEFKGQFECLGGNTEKHKTFSFLIKKKIRKVDNDGNEDIIAISHKIKLM